MIKFLDEYRDANLSLQIAEKIKSISTKKINIMEVCGGHTMAIRKNGIHKIVGDKINLISGPGCPVCVTSMSDIDTAIALSKEKDVILCTFGDLFYVPGTESSFAKRKAEGSDIRVVYSIHDALNFAKENKDKKVIFISIGFETTTPTSAACILEAKEKGIDNFFILALNKTMPYALKAILENEKCTVDALLCPGHVSTITGLSIYRFIVDELKIPCCISGFEPTDLMASVYILAEMCEKNEAKLINGYNRAVFEEGNEKATYMLYNYCVMKKQKVLCRKCLKKAMLLGEGLGLSQKVDLNSEINMYSLTLQKVLI